MASRDSPRRIVDQSSASSELHSQLWLSPPDRDRFWLPAAIVNGEGIFLEFSTRGIQTWLEGNSGAAVQERIRRLEENYLGAASGMRACFRVLNELHPAFVMIHTFAHIFMNQLTFECGYSSASAARKTLLFKRYETPPWPAYSFILQQVIRKEQWAVL